MDAVHGPGVTEGTNAALEPEPTGRPAPNKQKWGSGERQGLIKLGWSKAQIDKMDADRGREFIQKKQGPPTSADLPPVKAGIDSVVQGDTFRAGEQHDKYVITEMENSAKLAQENPAGRRPVTDAEGQTGEWTGQKTAKPDWMRVPGGGPKDYYDATDVLTVIEKLKAGRWPREERGNLTPVQERIAEQLLDAIRDDATEEKAAAFGPGVDIEDVLRGVHPSDTAPAIDEDAMAKGFFADVNRMASEETARPPVSKSLRPDPGTKEYSDWWRTLSKKEQRSEMRREKALLRPNDATTGWWQLGGSPDRPFIRSDSIPEAPNAGARSQKNQPEMFTGRQMIGSGVRNDPLKPTVHQATTDGPLFEPKPREEPALPLAEPAPPDTALRPYGRKVQELKPEHLETQGGLWWVDKTEGDQVTQEPAHGAQVTTKYGKAWTNGHIVDLNKPPKGIVIDPERMQSKSAGIEKVLTPPATRVVLDPVARQGDHVILRRSDGPLVMMRSDYLDHFLTRYPGAELIQDAKAINAPVLVLNRGKPRGAIMGMNFEETPEMRALADKPAEPEATGASEDFSILR